MMHIKRTVVSCVLLVALCAGGAAGQEWTRFRGPDGTGIGKAGGIPAKIEASTFAWKVKLPGPGHSSPVLWGDKVFLTCEGPGKTSRQIVCVSATDGKQLWTWSDRFATYRHNRLNSFAASTPACDAQRVYVTWISGDKHIVVAIDHSGKKVWQREMSDFKAKHGAGASPIVVGKTVIVSNDHVGSKSFLAGLDVETGQTRWKIDRISGPTSYITPGIYRPAGGKAEVIFISSSHGVTSVDPAGGKVNWEVPTKFNLKSGASPVVAGGLIFASSGQGGGGRESAVVRPGGGGKAGEIVYKLGREVAYVPTPIAVGEHIFVLNDNGTVTCIEPKTGKHVWQEKLSGVFYPSPVCIDGRLYIINNKGEMTVIQAGPKYKVLATSTLPEVTQATPAVANGCMYIRTLTQLICVKGAK